MTAFAGLGAVRIQHVVLSLRPGGLENGVVNLVNSLDPERFQSSVCCLDAAGAFAERLRPGIEVRVMGRAPGVDPRLLWRLVRLFRSSRTELVHTRNSEALFYGGLAALLARVPGLVHSEHGRVAPESPRRRRAQRWLSHFVDASLAVSEDLRRRLADEVGVPREAVTLVYNGVDCERFRPGGRAAARQRLGMSPAPTVVGAVGRLVPVKSYDTLLKAARGLPPGTEAWLVGEGELRPELEALARDWLPPGSVTFLGHRDDLPELLPAFDVFVLPSLTEGVSNTLLEAMACGLPPVVSRVGGNTEIVQDGVTGLVFPPGDDQTLALLLRGLCASADAREALGRRAAEHVRCHFSLEAMVAGYDRVYAEVVERRGRLRG